MYTIVVTFNAKKKFIQLFFRKNKKKITKTFCPKGGLQPPSPLPWIRLCIKSSFCFSNIKIIAVPAASFVNDLRSLRTIKAVFVRKEGFDAACVLKDDLEVDERIEVGYTGFQTFGDLYVGET